MKVSKVEEPVTLVNHSIWIDKDEDEDWGALPDSVYHHRVFAPNRVAVVITQNGDQYFTHWMQAREEHWWGPSAPNRTRIVGTLVFNGSIYEWPDWARKAAELAIEEAKKDEQETDSGADRLPRERDGQCLGQSLPGL